MLERSQFEGTKIEGWKDKNHEEGGSSNFTSELFCFYNFSQSKMNVRVKYFPIWVQNRLISTGLEPVLNYAEK